MWWISRVLVWFIRFVFGEVGGDFKRSYRLNRPYGRQPCLQGFDNSNRTSHVAMGQNPGTLAIIPKAFQKNYLRVVSIHKEATGHFSVWAPSRTTRVRASTLRERDLDRRQLDLSFVVLIYTKYH